MIRFIVSVAMALLALLAAYVVEGGNPMALLGLTAFVITFFVPLFGVLAIWQFQDWRRAWSHAFHVGGKDEARVSVALWTFSEFACYLAGILGSLVGGILIMGNLGGADWVHLGHSFGALLVAPLYGVTFGLVCRILKSRVESLHP